MFLRNQIAEGGLTKAGFLDCMPRPKTLRPVSGSPARNRPQSGLHAHAGLLRLPEAASSHPSRLFDSPAVRCCTTLPPRPHPPPPRVALHPRPCSSPAWGSNGKTGTGAQGAAGGVLWPHLPREQFRSELARNQTASTPSLGQTLQVPEKKRKMKRPPSQTAGKWKRRPHISEVWGGWAHMPNKVTSTKYRCSLKPRCSPGHCQTQSQAVH